MKMKKRHLIILMTMVMGLMGMTTEKALAQTWQSISGTISSNPNAYNVNAGDTKYYKLSGDVYSYKSLSVSGTLYLDLNGHVWQIDYYNYVMSVESGGKLIISDSSPNTKHWGKAENKQSAHTSGAPSLPYKWNYSASYTSSTSGAIEIDGGIITGGMGTLAGGIAVKDGGELVMDGGTIAGNFIYCSGIKYSDSDVTSMYEDQSNFTNGYFTKNGFGGGIYVYPTGKFTMNGGRICYNFATLAGGGVHTSSKDFTMNGGRIDHNSLCNTPYSFGGGVYVSHSVDHQSSGNAYGELVMNHGSVDNNTAPLGGGVYLSPDAKVTLYNDAAISSNTAKRVGTTASGKGGGLYVDAAATLTLNGSCQISNNNASEMYGGGIQASGTSGKNAKVIMNGGTISGNTAMSGAGVIIYNYAQFDMNDGTISGNTATGEGGSGNGGAVYVQNATFNLKKGTLENNTASRYGGAININIDAVMNLGESGAVSIKGNSAKLGGGISQEAGDCSISLNSNVTIENNEAQFDGGGLMIEKGSVTMAGATIKNNTAGNCGGGIALRVKRIAGNITFTMNSGTITENTAGSSNDNSYEASEMDYFRSGAGVSITENQGTSNSVTVNLNGGTISNNTMGNYGLYGGGIYVNIVQGSATINLTGGINVSGNSAKAGGGVYTLNNRATTFNMTNGSITGNSATDGNGGGVCLDANTTLKLSGTGSVTGNSATGGQGGGVYMGGAMEADGSSLTVTGNTVGSANNNVYLPSGKTITAGSSLNPDVHMGIYTQNTATSSTQIPVLTGTTAKLNQIYTAMQGGTSMIRDDRSLHQPYYPGSTTLYFALIEFDYPVFTSDFQNPINTPEKLYQFMCWVNGVNGYGTAHPSAEGVVTADIDASGFTKMWIPIGEANVIGTTSPYTGTFNGNGHTISGLTLTNSTYLYANYGLFGTTNGGSIQDVFVDGCNFSKSGAGTLGTLVGKMTGGTVQRCGASGTLSTNNSSCVTGGLVGKMEGGTVHSSFATTQMTGYQMGGLVGELATGCNLYNSFANVRLTESGSAYVGGLVGVNAGTVENCYAREQSGSSHGSHFGYLVGANQKTVSGTTTNGNLNYCYAPNTPYTASGVAGTTLGLSTFTATSTPYLYKHADNQMTANDNNSYIENGAMTFALGKMKLRGLLATLNNWVSANSGQGYSTWMRTSASPINDDYPLFNYTDYECVASTDGIALEYGAFNAKFGEYVTANTGTVYVYQTPAVLASGSQDNVSVSNSGKNTKLYVAEDVALKPTSATGDIIATVGVTLDNSAGADGANPTWGGTDEIDWHMFSTSLQGAPLGINYADNTQEYPFLWGSHPSNGNGAMPYWRFYDDASHHGYFPSMEYGWAAANSFTYDATNTGASTYGNWFNDWDFYAYYEPEYHWINMKRNGNSHWHEDYPDIKINYKSNGTGDDWTNEENLIQGRGYLVATAEPTYLQCGGTLAKGEVSVALTSSAWVRTGYNMLGNPYQSYLDFNAFAAENSIDSYYIIDEDAPIKGYAKYAKDASENEYIASSYIHPHQGFMVIVPSGRTVTFTEAMRVTELPTGITSGFRGDERNAYPLVNLIATEENGTSDVCTVELGRPDQGGAPVMRNMRICKGLVYCRYDDADWSIAFTRPGLTQAAIRFETTEDAAFTMTWDTENGDFSYLHLIDNMTGADIDCLQQTEYMFTSKVDDYASRFRLVFGYTGIGEPEAPEPVEGPTPFAFQVGDEIVVNGEGRLEIIDMLGRVLDATMLYGEQSRVALPANAAGVYLLRIRNENGTRTQKIVIR